MRSPQIVRPAHASVLRTEWEGKAPRARGYKAEYVWRLLRIVGYLAACARSHSSQHRPKYMERSHLYIQFIPTNDLNINSPA